MAEAPEAACAAYSAATKMCALAAVASIWMHKYYFVLFARSGCAKPAPACPQQIDNHGAIAYISTSQSVFLDLLMGCFVLFAIPAVFGCVITFNLCVAAGTAWVMVYALEG